ncbi:MAG: response regulator, partial [Lachnospiraceae bacterium]|nr:response regulator [Lachnospiraceae bacterium]
MAELVFGIQYASIIALFVECWVVFKNWRERLHSYLFFAGITNLVNNVGYLLELKAHSEEAYLTALKLSYLGRIWIGFALFLFVAELVRVKIPNSIKYLLALIHSAIYVAVLTTEKTGLYYYNMRFVSDGVLPSLRFKAGIVHDFLTGMLVLYISVGMIMLITTWYKEKNDVAKKRLLMVFFAVVTLSVFVLIQMFKLFGLTIVYDVTMLGYPISTFFMFIAIFRYRLLDTETLARDYVIDELSEGIIAVDAKERLIFYNKPALALFPNLKTDSKGVTGMLQRTIDSGKPLSLGERIYTPEKNILYQNEVVSSTIYALVDNTDYYRYMDELKEQKRIADNANKAKSVFLANMSHEIRTPINAVLGMDEMILRESREKDILSYAQDIQTAGRTLLSLINDILDFSKIEEGKMEILPSQYELSFVIGDLANMIKDRAEKKGLHFEIKVNPETPHTLYGDEIRIKQIAVNLLTNAVKYTEQGTVRLEVGFRRHSDEEILLRFQVSDTGIGMKKEDMEKLFSPFSRIEESRNRAIEGTGLGMSIVKQLLGLMDSHLEVKSEYGKGSDFSFEIRQKVIKWDSIGDFTARYEAEAAKREEYHELFQAPDAQVLVVDDTEVNLIVIKNLLKRTRVKIDTVRSGKEAINAAQRKQYDVILIDHMMPEMDGIETLQKLKEETEKPSVYIALTANAVYGAREMYLAAGFADYLSKPVDGRQLEETLKKYLPEEKLVSPKTEEKIEAEEDVLMEEALDSEVVLKYLQKIPELDIDHGITNCDSEEGYLAVLEVFHETAEQEADAIEKLYEG